MENGEDFSTNVLLIGRSGVGKSTLLNYLMGKEAEKTGSGAPVTGKGIFPHKYKLGNDLSFVLWDSWGLEPDKLSEWKNMVQSEIQKRDAGCIKEWFHAVVYCINAHSDRVENFDAEFIQELENSGNNVIVAITNCNAAEDGEKLEIRLKQLGVREKNIVKINSKNTTKIGGKSVSQFGRENLFVLIENSLWRKIALTIPEQCRRYAMNLINSHKSVCYKYIDKTVEVLNHHQDEIREYCQNRIDRCNNGIRVNIDDKISAAIKYYQELSKRLSPVQGETFKVKVPSVDARFYCDDFWDTVGNFVKILIPFYAPFHIRRERDETKNKYRRNVDEAFEKMISCVEENTEKMREYLLKQII